MVDDKWLELLSKFSDVELSEFPFTDLVPVELLLLSPSIGLVGKSRSI